MTKPRSTPTAPPAPENAALGKPASVAASATRGAKQAPDFSPQAVARAVLQQTLQKPLVLYPTAIGLLGGLAALLLGPSMLFVLPAAIGLGLGLGGWALDYGLRRDRHAADYLNRLRQALAGRSRETAARLRQDFSALDSAVGLAQLQQLEAKFAAFEQVLGGKLDPRELTYSRYQGMAEQVILGALDNLARIADTLRGLSAIDAAHASERLAQLHSDGIDSTAQDREIAALSQRLDLQQQQRERIDGWLAENEDAMTHIDQVMAALAALDTRSGHASVSLDSAMAELRTLAERAQQYSSSSH